MLNITFIKTFELAISAEIVWFNSLTDFAFSLDGQVAVLLTKLTEFVLDEGTNIAGRGTDNTIKLEQIKSYISTIHLLCRSATVI
jgi:hypothetical protein